MSSRATIIAISIVNKNASAVTEAELRSSDRTVRRVRAECTARHVQDQLPGASQPHWDFTVTGKASDASLQSDPQLTAAVSGYAAYSMAPFSQPLAAAGHSHVLTPIHPGFGGTPLPDLLASTATLVTLRNRFAIGRRMARVAALPTEC
ncbi:MAG TPA: hypothetical protein VFG00_10815 [Acidothermaceae bacterium]|nr:hypothetical protein [Acidothermaceae bacterium]